MRSSVPHLLVEPPSHNAAERHNATIAPQARADPALSVHHGSVMSTCPCRPVRPATRAAVDSAVSDPRQLNGDSGTRPKRQATRLIQRTTTDDRTTIGARGFPEVGSAGSPAVTRRCWQVRAPSAGAGERWGRWPARAGHRRRRTTRSTSRVESRRGRQHPNPHLGSVAVPVARNRARASRGWSDAAWWRGERGGRRGLLCCRCALLHPWLNLLPPADPTTVTVSRRSAVHGPPHGSRDDDSCG